jgi:hypothetical protein
MLGLTHLLKGTNDERGESQYNNGVQYDTVLVVGLVLALVLLALWYATLGPKVSHDMQRKSSGTYEELLQVESDPTVGFVHSRAANRRRRRRSSYYSRVRQFIHAKWDTELCKKNKNKRPSQ